MILGPALPASAGPFGGSANVYAQFYSEGRRRADQDDFCPPLSELRRRGFSDADADAFGRGFYHRRLEIDPLNAADAVVDLVKSIGACTRQGLPHLDRNEHSQQHTTV